MSKGYRVHVEDRGEGTTLQVGDGGRLVQVNLPEDIADSDIPQIRMMDRSESSNRSSSEGGGGGGGGGGGEGERFYKVDLMGKNAKTLYGNNTQVLNIRKAENSARNHNRNASNQREEREPSIQPTTVAVQATQNSELESMGMAATGPGSLDQSRGLSIDHRSLDPEQTARKLVAGDIHDQKSSKPATDQRSLDLEQTTRKLVAGGEGDSSSSRDLSVEYRSQSTMVDLHKNQRMKGSGSVYENGHGAAHEPTKSPVSTDAVGDKDSPSPEMVKGKSRSKKKTKTCRNQGVNVNIQQAIGVTSSTQTDEEGPVLFSTIQGSGHVVQLGSYNQSVDIRINEEALMTAKEGGQLTVKDEKQTIFTLIWKDLTTIIQETKEELQTKWTLHFSKLFESLTFEILQLLMNNKFEDLRTLVSNVFRKYNAQLKRVCSGSIVFIFGHGSRRAAETMMADKDNVKRMFQDLLVRLGKVDLEFELESSLIEGSNIQNPRSLAVVAPPQITAEQVETIVQAQLKNTSEDEAVKRRDELKELGSQLKALHDESHRMQEDISYNLESAKRDMDRATKEQLDLIRSLIESRIQSASQSPSPQVTMDSTTSESRIPMKVPKALESPITSSLPSTYGYSPQEILAYNATYSSTAADQDEAKKELKAIPSSQASASSPGQDVEPQGAVARVADQETRKVTTSEHTREGSSESQQHLNNQAESLLASFNVQCSGDENRRLVNSVARALEHGPRHPRANGLDTILCLDVSESMQASGVEKVKEMAIRFVDLIEEIAEQHNLEENIGVVAMGGRAQLLQQLTNDYGLVREKIESLECRGRSPMREALLVCIAAIKGRGTGGFMSVGESHRIHPRIIFFTDGLASVESHELGPDNLDPSTDANFKLIQFVGELNPKKGRSVPNPITWVPVGKADTNALQGIAQFAGGLLIKDDEIHRLSNYFRMEQAIGTVYSCVKDMKPKDESMSAKMEAATNVLIGDMTQEEKKEVIEAVKVKLESKDVAGPDSGPYNFDIVYEDPALPPLGSRVIKGADWTHQDQDDDGPGTIVNHSDEKGYLWVLWDKNNKVCRYSYSHDGKQEVKLHHLPRNITDIRMIDTGASVKKGSDWSPEDKDDPGIGTVIRKSANGRVKVKWQPSGKITTCSVGYDGKFEVELCSSEEQTSQINKHLESKKQTENPRSKIDGIDQPSPNRPHVLWQWLDGKGRWRLYDKEHVAKLNKEFNRKPHTSCILQKRGKSYRVLFKYMVEKSVDGASTRYDVRRVVVSDQERDELICLEVSLDEGSSWLQSS